MNSKSRLNYKRLVCAALILIFLVGGNADAQTNVPPENQTSTRSDVQYRPELVIRARIYKRLEAAFETRLVNQDDDDESRTRFSLAYSWKPNKYLEIEPEYLFQFENEGDEREREHRVRFPVTGILPIKKWELSNRNLFERRYIEGEKSFRYRNRSRIDREFTIKGKKYNAYLYDEAFYDSRVRTWRFNRVYLGAERNFNKRFGLDVYYFRQNGKTGLSPDLHVFGTEFGIRLR